jgi:hypothetical protein
VEITAGRAGINGGANELTTKTITVTVTDLDDGELGTTLIKKALSILRVPSLTVMVICIVLVIVMGRLVLSSLLLTDDEAPTDIQINDTVFINGKVVLTNDKGANFLLGTLSAADIDTAG